ncbi:hypothetical protein BC938DRAFT_475572 [Jimgerdemannia flammicorona]|uniref:Uncharacterized protein n=1 Tax=Jimgerdemannia flammicorona TaxID=994334 RepID=A0A433PS78_9FUNG|nr:hypothetical protein BC938DRAFT_475572 [Jimgerdemannia flammicorona]
MGTFNFIQSLQNSILVSPIYTNPFPILIDTAPSLSTVPTRPGFAFLMAIGIIYFICLYKELRWMASRLMRHFFVRGALLMVANHLMKPVHFVTIVLFVLGINFFLSALASPLANHLYTRRVRSPTAHNETGVPKIAEAEARTVRIRIFGLLVLAVVFCEQYRAYAGTG